MKAPSPPAPLPRTSSGGEGSRSRYYILFLFAFVLGCGSDDNQAITIVDTRVTVIDLNGEQKTISIAELYDSKTGQPAVKSVLVIDRRTNQQVFVDLDQLPVQSHSDSPYIPVTDG